MAATPPDVAYQALKSAMATHRRTVDQISPRSATVESVKTELIGNAMQISKLRALVDALRKTQGSTTPDPIPELDKILGQILDAINRINKGAAQPGDDEHIRRLIDILACIEENPHGSRDVLYQQRDDRQVLPRPRAHKDMGIDPSVTRRNTNIPRHPAAPFRYPAPPGAGDDPTRRPGRSFARDPIDPPGSGAPPLPSRPDPKPNPNEGCSLLYALKKIREDLQKPNGHKYYTMQELKNCKAVMEQIKDWEANGYRKLLQENGQTRDNDIIHDWLESGELQRHIDAHQQYCTTVLNPNLKKATGEGRFDPEKNTDGSDKNYYFYTKNGVIFLAPKPGKKLNAAETREALLRLKVIALDVNGPDATINIHDIKKATQLTPEQMAMTAAHLKLPLNTVSDKEAQAVTGKKVVTKEIRTHITDLMQPVAKKRKPEVAGALMSKSGNLYTARTELDWLHTAGGVPSQYQHYATEMKIAYQKEFALGAREVVSETQQGIKAWREAGEGHDKRISPHLHTYTPELAAFLEEEARDPQQSIAAGSKATETETIRSMFDETASWGANFPDPYENVYCGSDDGSDAANSDKESERSSGSRSRSQDDGVSRTYAGGRRGGSDERGRKERQVTFADEYRAELPPDFASFSGDWDSGSSYSPYSRGRDDGYEDESFYEHDPFSPTPSRGYDSSYGRSGFWGGSASSGYSGDGPRIEEVDDDGQPIHPHTGFGPGKRGK